MRASAGLGLALLAAVAAAAEPNAMDGAEPSIELLEFLGGPDQLPEEPLAAALDEPAAVAPAATTRPTPEVKP
jgi:hypothetical protein